MNSDSSLSLPPERKRVRAELATLVSTVADREQLKAEEGLWTACDESDVDSERLDELIQRSGLVDEDDWRHFQDKTSRGESLVERVRQLMDASMLSSWQLQKLVRGKYKGFVVGNYRVRDALGQGAAGAVYAADHQTMRRPVALKILAASLAKSDRSKQATFARLGQMGELDHDNVVHYFDVGEASGAVYLVMESIDGRSLYQLSRRFRRLPRAVVAEIASQFLDGASHVRQQAGVFPRAALDNIVADRQGILHLLPLDLTQALPLKDAADYDETSLLDHALSLRKLLCTLDPLDNDASDAPGPWHQWSDEQLHEVAQSEDGFFNSGWHV